MADDFWEQAARRDPLWAILSDSTKRGRRWDLGSFFETGRREISLLLYQLRRLGRFPTGTRALDFGCGVGRLTQALAGSFGEVVGVDVSPTMIRLARELNRYPHSARYVLNQSAALEQFPSDHFGLVYSDIVLQHLEPDAAQRYLVEFLRILSPGGVAVFQLPSHRHTGSSRAKQPANMPPEAYRARVEILEGLPPLMQGGGTETILVEVRNDSSKAWDQVVAGSIRVGNHWRDAHGEMLIQDDGRTLLPSTVGPGEAVRLALPVRAPIDSGTFGCEIDLVHEGISWFGDRGSPTASIAVNVASAAAASPTSGGVEAGSTAGSSAPVGTAFPDIYAALPPLDAADGVGAFPMHGVARGVVLELLAEHGGDAFFIEDDERGGPEWQGYRYYVSKKRSGELR